MDFNNETTDLMFAGGMVGALALLWFVLYLWSLLRLNKALKADGDATWQQAGSPSLLKTNLQFYRFVFGRAIATASQPVRFWGRCFRLLTMIGVFLCIAVLYLYSQL